MKNFEIAKYIAVITRDTNSPDRSRKKKFIPINPSYLGQLMAMLPDSLSRVGTFIFMKIIREVVREKNKQSAYRWSPPISIEDLLNGLETNPKPNSYRMYRDKTLALHQQRFLYRFPFWPGERKTPIVIYTYEKDIFLWKPVFPGHEIPMVPVAIKRLIESHDEAVRRIVWGMGRMAIEVTSETREKIARAFCNWIYSEFVSQMRKDIAGTIRPLQRGESPNSYLKSYLPNALMGLDDYEGMEITTEMIRDSKLPKDHKEEMLSIAAEFEGMSEAPEKKFVFDEAESTKKCLVGEAESTNSCLVESTKKCLVGVAESTKKCLVGVAESTKKCLVEGGISDSSSSVSTSCDEKDAIIIERKVIEEENILDENIGKQEDMKMETTQLVEVNVSDARRRNLMRQMVPPDEEFVEDPRRTQKKVKREDPNEFPAGEVPTRKPVTEDGSAFCHKFVEIVKRRHPDARFACHDKFKKEVECGAALRIIDMLRREEALLPVVIEGWIEWYSQYGLKEKDVAKWPVTVAYLAQTWKQYRKNKPNPKNVIAERKVVNHNLGDTITPYLQAQFAKGGVTEVSIQTACQTFGVVIVACYLQKAMALTAEAATKLVATAMEAYKREPGDLIKIQLVFDATTRYGCGRATQSHLVLSRWRDELKHVWSKAGCHEKQKPTEEKAKTVNAFFEASGI